MADELSAGTTPSSVEVYKSVIVKQDLQLAKYEENGPAKLYYALKRKAWEMADLLNAKDLKNVALDDPKDKTFDRMKVIWNDASSIATAVAALGVSSGITEDEEKDIKGNRRSTTPESMSNVLGNFAGQQD